jgi:hypothetical protein
MQPNIPNLERSPLSYVYADEVGRILIKDVNMPQSIQEELLADRARQSREEGHGDGEVVRGAMWWVGRSSGYRCIEKGSMCG